jgi:uracil-DNA glycosylase family 4
VQPTAPLARCDECPLQDRPLVPGYGPATSGRVIVGEAPGEKEVFERKPFVGRAGRRLDVVLSAAEIDRSMIFFTNALLCYPAGKPPRPPAAAVRACRERLIAEIRQKAPRKVLALGRTAAKALTGKTICITEARLRDLPFHYLDDHTKVRVTYHPSSLSRNPEWPGRFDKDVRWLGPH